MAYSTFTNSISLDSPIFLNRITTPIVYGGVGTTSTLTLNGTSNVSASRSIVLIQPTGGNVGIGTTAPTNNLQIGCNVAGGQATTTPLTLSLGNTYNCGTVGTNLKFKVFDYCTDVTYNTGMGVSAGQFEIVAGNSSAMAFFTNGANQRMTILCAGNVGIGIILPAYRLHVLDAHLGGVIADTLKVDTVVAGGDNTQPTGYGSIVLSGNGYDWGAIRTIQTNPSGSWVNRLAFFGMNGSGGALVERMSINNSGVMTINSLATGSLTSASGVITSSSDQTLKIADGFIDCAIDKVMQLTPRYFYWNEKSGLDECAQSIRQLGFFAQEVNKVLGEEVANTPEEGKDWGYYDRGIIAMLTKAMQEQQEIIKENKVQNDSLIKRIEILENK